MNAYTNKVSHAYKGVTRDLLARFAPEGNQKGLFLPSNRVADVEVCLGAKTVSKSTDFVFIEKDRDLIPAISGRSKELGLNSVEIHAGEVTDFDFTASHRAKPFDIVYLDLCGQMTGAMFQWIFQHRESLNEVKALAFTFECNPRQNNLFWGTYDEDTDYHYLMSEKGKTGIIGRDIFSRENQVAYWSVTMAAIALGRFTFSRINKGPNRFAINDLFAYSEAGKGSPMVFCSFSRLHRTSLPNPETASIAREYGKAHSIRATGKRKERVLTPVKGGPRFIDSLYGLSKTKLKALHKSGNLKPAHAAQVTGLLRQLS